VQSIVMTVALAAIGLLAAHGPLGKALGVTSQTLKIIGAVGAGISLALLVGIDLAWQHAIPQPPKPEPLPKEPPASKSINRPLALEAPLHEREQAPGPIESPPLKKIKRPAVHKTDLPLVKLQDFSMPQGAVIRKLEPVWDKLAGYKGVTHEILSYLDTHYFYRSVAADGNCFFYAVVSGLLHVYTEAQLRGEALNSWEDPQFLVDDMEAFVDPPASTRQRLAKHKNMVQNELLALKQEPTREKLHTILNNTIFVKELAYYLRVRSISHAFRENLLKAEAAYSCTMEHALKDTIFAAVDVCMNSLQSLELVWADTYNRDFNIHFMDHLFPFMVIFHVNHCECLILKKVIERIATPVLPAP
jgi:hypothetical protein